ncbi:MAG: hypothetical protein IJ318_00455 [Clostridia bacterium]|nr:hypothetical protein [Clostridia bacterium]
MPKIFGIEHIIYMIISFALTITALILIKKFCKTEKSKKLAIKISGAVLLLFVILNNLFIYLWVNTFQLVSLCGTVSLLFAIFAIFCKKDSSCLHFITYTALFTGLIATIYPTYIGQGSTIFFPSTITSLIHHSLSFYMAVLVLELGYITPNIKKWYAWPLGYFGLITFGLFNIKIRGKADSMNINSPLIANTPFNWFYLALMFMAVYIVFLFVYDTIKNKKQCVIVVTYNKIVNLFKKNKDEENK